MSGRSDALAFRHVRATVPLPLADNDGIRFPSSDVRWFERRLVVIGSGFRKHLRVRGLWRDDGRLYRERVAVYVATIEAHQVPELQSLLAEARTRFRQKEILGELAPVAKILVGDRRRTEAAAILAAAEPSS